MTIVVRFVDRDNTIKERFLELAHCDTSTSDQALSDNIIDCLANKYHLDIQDSWGNVVMELAIWLGSILVFHLKVFK